MSLTNPPDYVRYACTCGSLKPITRMYFCRHCLKVRCGYCVCHEVDSHYCSNCMENLPSSEARLKKNRCANCFDCPSCFHTLSFRTTTGIRSAEDGTKTTGKVYYLACLFCRWTSRDVGIPDQTVVEGDQFLDGEIEKASIVLMEMLQKQETEDCIEVGVRNIAKLLPASLTPQMISSNSSYCYAFVTKCYGKLLSELCKLLNNKPMRSNVSLMMSIQKVFVNNANALMFSESLAVLLSEFKDTNGPSEKLDLIIGLLELLVKSDSLQLAALSLCKTGQDTIIAQEWMRTEWLNTVQMLISLPNHISNKLGKNTPDCFVPDCFTKIITSHIVKCIVFLGEIKRLDIDIDVKPLSVLFSKLVINYKQHSFLKCMLEIVHSWCCQRDVLFSQILQNVMLKLDQKCIEWVALFVLQNCTEISVFRILNSCVLRSEHWKHTLCHKLPLLMYNSDDNVLINLITYLGNVHKCFQTDEDLASKAVHILTDLLLSLTSVWSDKFALVHTPQEQHLYITKAIILAVKYITENKQEMHIDTSFISSVKSKFFSGVPIHLDSSVEVIRSMGMIASELFVKYVNKVVGDEEKFVLEFDYSKLKSESLAIVDSVKTVVDMTLVDSNKIDGDDILFDMLIECGIVHKTMENIESNIGINSKLVKYSNDKFKDIKSSVLLNDNEEEELDSDDDFELYDTSNDTELSVKKQPSYLRDLIEGFREDKDADIWVGSLQVCESLIYKQLPQDDVSLGLEILDILLCLEKHFYCEDFETLRFSAALAIVVVNPLQAAEFLCSKFHEDLRRYSIAHRMLMLDLLSGAARVLSGVSKKDAEADRNKDFTKQCVLIKERNNTPQWETVVKGRIENSTRRFFKPRHAPVTCENRFSKVAGSFLFPLLRGSTKTTQVISYHMSSTDSLKTDPHMLLVHFLQTCTIIMVSSVNCPIVLRMAKELLEATWNIRFHTESKVREAVIGCIASVVLSVPSHQLYSDLWDEVLEAKMWLSSVASSEGIIGGKSCEVDIQCRTFAAQVLFLMSDALDKTKDFA